MKHTHTHPHTYTHTLTRRNTYSELTIPIKMVLSVALATQQMNTNIPSTTLLVLSANHLWWPVWDGDSVFFVKKFSPRIVNPFRRAEVAMYRIFSANCDLFTTRQNPPRFARSAMRFVLAIVQEHVGDVLTEMFSIIVWSASSCY